MKKAMKKQGFTLIELMVVVIIVGILAAVAVPLMSANKDKAIASEAVAALGTIASAQKMYTLEKGSAAATVSDLIGAGYVKLTDFDGTYFDNADYPGTTKIDADGRLSAKTTFTDSQGTSHSIAWDTTSNTYEVTK